MAKKTKISLIIPVYNEEQTIESILDIACRSVVNEIIVVNDGSSDASAAKIQQSATKDARIRLINHNSNSGVGAARATGIRKSRGDVLVFLDADLQNPDVDIIAKICDPVLSSEYDFVLGAFENSGRVTELTIRPLLKVCFPELANLRQPLSGQFACRREYLYPDSIEHGNQMSGILLDAYLAGARIGEVDIGTIVHSKRPLEVKQRQAFSECDALIKRYDRLSLKELVK